MGIGTRTTTGSSDRDPARRMVEYPSGAYVFREGDLGTEMYVIHAGEVEILRRGQENARLAVLEKGDFFGEIALLDHTPRSASARVRSDATLLRVDGAMFADLIRAQPEIAVGIMRRLCQRLQEQETRLELGATGGSRAPIRSRPDMPDPVPDAVLVHRGSGTAFPLFLDRPVLVGRGDPVTGAQPTVDLTSLDGERSSSRQHGRLFRDDDKLYVMEELGATNGTYLNDTRLRTGNPAEVRSGDRIRFGLVTLELELR